MNGSSLGADVKKGELTAVIEPAPEGGFWAICLEIPGANGQGESIEEAKEDLQAAIELIPEDHEADICRARPPDALRITLARMKVSADQSSATRMCRIAARWRPSNGPG